MRRSGHLSSLGARTGVRREPKGLPLGGTPINSRSACPRSDDLATRSHRSTAFVFVSCPEKRRSRAESCSAGSAPCRGRYRTLDDDGRAYWRPAPLRRVVIQLLPVVKNATISRGHALESAVWSMLPARGNESSEKAFVNETNESEGPERSDETGRKDQRLYAFRTPKEWPGSYMRHGGFIFGD